MFHRNVLSTFELMYSAINIILFMFLNCSVYLQVHMWAGISYMGRTDCCLFTGVMDLLINQQILEQNFHLCGKLILMASGYIRYSLPKQLDNNIPFWKKRGGYKNVCLFCHTLCQLFTQPFIRGCRINVLPKTQTPTSKVNVSCGVTLSGGYVSCLVNNFFINQLIF